MCKKGEAEPHGQKHKRERIEFHDVVRTVIIVAFSDERGMPSCAAVT